jgi:hypothetical protein
MLSPVVDFDEVIKAYESILQSPEKSIKLGIRYG